MLELRWRDVSILLTGDIGTAVERDVAADVRAGAAARRQGAASRQPHVEHAGVRRAPCTPQSPSSAPDAPTTSATRVPEVLERYRAAGAEIFRTDQDGAVTVTTDGYSLHVDTFAEQTEPPRRHEDTKEK